MRMRRKEWIQDESEMHLPVLSFIYTTLKYRFYDGLQKRIDLGPREGFFRALGDVSVYGFG